MCVVLCILLGRKKKDEADDDVSLSYEVPDNNDYTTAYDDEIEKIIQWMGTEEYFETHRSNTPNYHEGGDIIKKWADELWKKTNQNRNLSSLWRRYKESENRLMTKSMAS